MKRTSETLPKKFNGHLGQKMPFVPSRLENPDSDEKDALFGLDTQITIFCFAPF
jgi:hypothetical protein